MANVSNISTIMSPAVGARGEHRGGGRDGRRRAGAAADAGARRRAHQLQPAGAGPGEEPRQRGGALRALLSGRARRARLCRGEGLLRHRRPLLSTAECRSTI